MQYSNLSDLITYLKYGTKLHIGVLFLGKYGSEKLALPYENTIHRSDVCMKFKNNRKCYECHFRSRNAAFREVLRTKKSCGGLCNNGVYEYTRPVIVNEDIVCIIFIGNILSDSNNSTITKAFADIPEILETMEKDFSFEQCESIGNVIESYISMLLFFSRSDDEKFDPLIENIKNYIEENLEYKIDLSRIASIYNYNKKYLGRLFKSKTGKAISEYVTERRLEYAKRLLLNTDNTVLAISELVGFRNVTYFNRIFRKCFGLSPTEYKKIYKI